MSFKSHANAFGAGIIIGFIGTAYLVVNDENYDVESQCTGCELSEDSIYLALAKNDNQVGGGVSTSRNSLKLLAKQAATAHGIPESIMLALVETESSWQVTALSPRGAVGLTQVMPDTASAVCGLDVTELYAPKSNLNCGAKYLARMKKRFKSWDMALKAYNGGPTRIAKGIIPKETRDYVIKIRQNGGNI